VFAGLFNQSIMMSGSISAPWMLNDDRSMRDLLQQYEDRVGCPQRRTSEKALVECMRAVPVSRLLTTEVPLVMKLAPSFIEMLISLIAF